MLDIGCGAGFDLYRASRLVGPRGLAAGIDLTAEMVSLARRNMALAAAANTEVRLVEGEEIPYPDCFFDMVLSNGVFNLSPCKQRLFAEIRRVLKSGGRLQFADIVLDGDLPREVAVSADAWSQ